MEAKVFSSEGWSCGGCVQFHFPLFTKTRNHRVEWHSPMLLGNLSHLSVSDLECYLFSVQIQVKQHQESLREMYS